MKLEEAIRISIRKYMEKHDFSTLTEALGKDMKYIKEFFDDQEELILGDAPDKTEAEEMEDELNG